VVSKFSYPNKALIDALVVARVIDDPVQVRRVLIDIQGSQPPMVYVEKYGDADRIAQVIADQFGPADLVGAPRDEPLQRVTKEV
jgi:hypothetical protein